MEFPPNPPGTSQGLGYYQAGPTRPASIQIISIFAIVFGALTVLCNGMTTITASISLLVSHGNAGVQNNFKQSLVMQILGVLQVLIGLALGAVELTGGIGGVQVRAWARRLLIRWAVAALVFHAISAAFGVYQTLTFTMPAIQKQMNRPGARGVPQGMGGAITAGSVGFLIVITIISSILPICVLVFWRSREVTEAFETTPTTM